ncbi:hypothetical protein LIA77_03119 [Sarocladium implicatum]|nr:hypothetical protein LIA77_03119 [Sarocladium implicatum]
MYSFAGHDRFSGQGSSRQVAGNGCVTILQAVGQPAGGQGIIKRPLQDRISASPERRQTPSREFFVGLSTQFDEIPGSRNMQLK